MSKSHIQAVAHLFCAAGNEETMEALLRFFFTPAERHALEGRVALIQALLQGESTQREIAQQLGVSIAKITAGSNELKRTPADLKAFLQTVLVDSA